MSIKTIILELFLLFFSLFILKLGLVVSLMISRLIAAWTKIEELQPIVLGILITLIIPITLSFVFRVCKIGSLIYKTIKKDEENKAWIANISQNQEEVTTISSNEKEIIKEQLLDLQQQLQTAQNQLEIAQKATLDSETAKNQLQEQVNQLSQQILVLKSPKKRLSSGILTRS